MEDCKKKILLFIPCFNLGGAEHQAFRFAHYLTQQGYQVCLGAFDDKGPVVDLCKKHNVEYTEIPVVQNGFVKKIFSFINRVLVHFFSVKLSDFRCKSYSLALFIFKRKFNTVVSYCAFCNVLLGTSRKIIKNLDKKYIWFQRDAGLLGDEWLYKKKDAIKSFDVVLANSISGQIFLKSRYDIDCKIVRNGVEKQISKFSIAKAKRVFNVENKIVVSMVANLHHNKNHMQLLKAWSFVCKKIDSEKLILLFAGYKGDTFQPLMEYVENNDLRNKVVFLGQVENVCDLLKATDIFAFASKKEGSPNSVIEACLAGLPIVSTDLPVIRDIVCVENYKFLDANDAYQMAQNLCSFINDKVFSKKIGNLNRKKCERLFDFDRNFNELANYL